MDIKSISLVGFISDQDLRDIRWNQLILEEISNGWGLKHGQAVVFCNKAQDRFRLVANFCGLPVLILPPVNPSDKISLYLKVSLFLKKFSSARHVAEHIEQELDLTRNKIAARKALASKSIKKRGK